MNRSLKIFNLVFFVLMVCVNALANILPIGYGNTGEISGKYPNLFTPAPITFSIWGLIYILIAIFILYQMDIFGDQHFALKILKLIGPWFLISCAMNTGWIFSWHYDVIWLSVVFMLGLLFSLIMLTSRVSSKALSKEAGEQAVPVLAKISRWAFELYLGWITAATIANISVFLVKLKWTGFGLPEQVWTVIVLLAGTLLGMLFITTRRNYMSAVGIIWAYCGIVINHVSQSGYAGKYPLIIAIAVVGIVMILSTGVIKAYLGDKGTKVTR